MFLNNFYKKWYIKFIDGDKVTLKYFVLDNRAC